MDKPNRAQITRMLLERLRHYFYTPPNYPPPQVHVLVHGVTNHANFPRGDPDVELEVLGAVNDLFRSGVLGWGHCLEKAFADPPYFHVTALGRAAAGQPSRDPANPDGYLQHLRQGGVLDDVAESYIAEGLRAYTAGCHKSAAVMVGAAAERLILKFRDLLEQRLAAVGKPVPAKLKDDRVKAVRDAITQLLEPHVSAMPRPLKESYPMHWPSLGEQLRVVRNDAGHPKSIEPVTPDLAHGNLLLFPTFAAIVGELERWAATHTF